MDTLLPQPTYTTIHEITVADLKKRATKIHYFGLGFIQIKLGNRERIHFYTELLPPLHGGDEDVHDHRYSFCSYILYGEYHQELFAIHRGTTHTIEEESCIDPTIPEKESMPVHKKVARPCTLKKIGEQTLSQGSSYFLHKDTFHRVRTTRAITFLVREEPSKERARVIYAKTSSRTCPFSKYIKEEELWGIVEKMLIKAKHGQ